MAPGHVELTVYDGLDNLPYFNPDVEQADPLPASVSDFRATVKAADGLLISCPEYAHGVPGTFKNALDWLVGGEEFTDMPVALFNTLPRASHAQRQLREIITTMAGQIVEEASVPVPLLDRELDADGIASDEELAGMVREAVVTFVEVIE